MPQPDRDAARTPRPAKTMDDIDQIATFIRARVEPLRYSAEVNSDEERAHQALLDIALVAQGVAQADVVRGDTPTMPFFYLLMAARQWRDHPEFLPEWTS
jgi:hypothetical protein